MTLVLIGLVGSYVTSNRRCRWLPGRGVHAYFAADYELAVEFVVEVAGEKRFGSAHVTISADWHGRTWKGLDAGLADFTQEDNVEINRTDRPVYDINGAVQHMPGRIRLDLEKVLACDAEGGHHAEEET